VHAVALLEILVENKVIGTDGTDRVVIMTSLPPQGQQIVINGLHIGNTEATKTFSLPR
jgi:hypothetical protein